MKYSFVIPVYNCETTLEACVGSILAQKMNDIEIILIDDGSMDSSGAVCDRLAASHTQIRTIHQSNSGVSAARNRGILEAKGDYLLFVDSDDKLLVFSDELLSVLSSQKPDMLIFGMRFQYYDGNYFLREDVKSYTTDTKMDIPSIGENFTSLFSCNYFSSSCNKFFKRDILKAYALSFRDDLSVYEDLEFSLRCISVCKNVFIASEAAYLYIHQQKASHIADRLWKIDNIVGYTDQIADSFFSLETHMTSESAIAQMRIALHDVYVIQLWAKLQKASYTQITYHCEQYQNSSYISKCLPYVQSKGLTNKPMISWLEHSAITRIWLYIRYRKVRNSVVKAIKRFLKK